MAFEIGRISFGRQEEKRSGGLIPPPAGSAELASVNLKVDEQAKVIEWLRSEIESLKGRVARLERRRRRG